MERTVTRTRNDTADDVVVLADATAPRSRIRWAAVFAGMVLSVGLLVLLSSLWLAIAYGSDEAFVVRNLEWFVGASAVGCLLIGGFLAGRLSGVPGAGTGLAHGLTLWALTLLVVLAIGIPSVINVLNLGRVATELQPTTSVIASGCGQQPVGDVHRDGRCARGRGDRRHDRRRVAAPARSRRGPRSAMNTRAATDDGRPEPRIGRDR